MTKRSYRPLVILGLYLSVSLLPISNSEALAQTTAQLDKNIFTVVECPPEFPGGFSALRAYLIDNVHYPATARNATIKGRVVVSFVVNVDGHLSAVTLVDGLGYGCDEEAVRVVGIMPRWIPGSQSGQAIRVKYTLPILFGTDYPQHYPRRSPP